MKLHRIAVIVLTALIISAGAGAAMPGTGPDYSNADDHKQAAATVLTESGHENRGYDLTGPEALDYKGLLRYSKASSIDR